MNSEKHKAGGQGPGNVREGKRVKVRFRGCVSVKIMVMVELSERRRVSDNIIFIGVRVRERCRVRFSE